MRSDDFSGLKVSIGGQETYEIGMRRVKLWQKTEEKFKKFFLRKNIFFCVFET